MHFYRVYLRIGNAHRVLNQVVKAVDCRDACSKVLIPKHNVQCLTAVKLDPCEELVSRMAAAETVLNAYQREARGVRGY